MAAHLAFNLAQGRNLSSLDGFADRDNSEAVLVPGRNPTWDLEDIYTMHSRAKAKHEFILKWKEDGAFWMHTEDGGTEIWTKEKKAAGRFKSRAAATKKAKKWDRYQGVMQRIEIVEVKA